MSADDGWERVQPGPGNPIYYACPRCGAGARERCRTVSGTNRPTDTHAARWELVDRWDDQRRRDLRRVTR